MADETPAVVAETPVVDAPKIDADIAEHHRPDDDGTGLVPRSAMNFVLMELQKLRDLARPKPKKVAAAETEAS